MMVSPLIDLIVDAVFISVKDSTNLDMGSNKRLDRFNLNVREHDERYISSTFYYSKDRRFLLLKGPTTTSTS
jgi:hypothetical protein